jgi:3-phosphoshikimate 1-carboxyvinyltransferase
VEVRGPEISIEGGAGPAALRAGAWRVPGDFSSAAFWLVGAAARQGASVTVRGVGLNPRRTALLDVLRRMGADVDVQPDDAGEWEPAGTLRVRGAALRGTEVAGGEIPNLIDELPLVAAAGALARGRTVIRDAAELRVKESDRIAAMAAVLRAFGVEVDERPDGMVVAGAGEVRGAGGGIESRGDHRIAMCAAVLATAGDGPVRIGGTDCVATSYPGFWNDLHRLAPGAVAKEET